jgi:hypothetical protein
VTKAYEKGTSDWRERRVKRKQVRYLLLSLGLACLASAIFCLVLWSLSQPSGSRRVQNPFEEIERATPVLPKR